MPSRGSLMPPGDHQPHVVDDLGRREVLVGSQDVEEAARLGPLAELVEPGQHRLFNGLGGAPADREGLGFLLEVRNPDAQTLAPVPDIAEVIGVEPEDSGERPCAHESRVAGDDVRLAFVPHGGDEAVAKRGELTLREGAAAPGPQEGRLAGLLQPGAGRWIEGQHVLAEGPGQEARLGGGAEDLRLILHRLDVVPAGHEPHLERGNPGDRLLLAQAGQDGIRVPVEFLGGDGRCEAHGGVAHAANASGMDLRDREGTRASPSRWCGRGSAPIRGVSP